MSPSTSDLGVDLQILKDVIRWDVRTWSDALRLWRSYTRNIEGARVLEVGAHDGGLSLYFAMQGCRVLCSDYHGPTPKANELHKLYGVADYVDYAAIDATQMALPDASFDLVCFKSVLGGIGRCGRVDRQKQAIAEMCRVLKPNGHLLFMENLAGSLLHKVFRRCFVSWGRDWRYLSLAEVPEMFSRFRKIESRCFGCLAALGRSERQRSALHMLDMVLGPIVPDSCKYMLAGVATK